MHIRPADDYRVDLFDVTRIERLQHRHKANAAWPYRLPHRLIRYSLFEASDRTETSEDAASEDPTLAWR